MLLLSYPPPFIYVHDPDNVRLTTAAIRSTLSHLVSEATDVPNLKYACVDAVACFSPRILFDTALNALAGWTPDWRDGAQNWEGPAGAETRRYNENFDAFVHGLQAISSGVSASTSSTSGMGGEGKSKARAEERAPAGERMVLIVERAERLKDNLPDLVVPLTRLAEMSQVEITTIFVSEVQWQNIRPSLRASPEPYYIDVPRLSKQATIDLLASSFPPAIPESSTSRATHVAAYHPSLKPLYAHFLASVYSICGPFTHDPLELSYIAAARWPGFVQPILDAHRQQLQEDAESATAADADDPDAEGDLEDPHEIPPVDEDARIRLLRLFTPSLTAALDTLYPRLTNAAHWARVHAPPPDLLTIHLGHAPEALVAQAAANAASIRASAPGLTEAGIDALPRMAKFVLVAAFVASTNPARSDLRMFGRGLDERAKRRRRKAGTPRKPKPGTTGTAVKLPQRLLGPLAFPLDRMIAILGVLLEENDADTRPVAPQYTLPGEYTEMEIARVAVYANIAELASMRLLVRISPVDSLDRTPTFKCGIGYDLATKLARSIGIMLNDLVYEAL
ncbi:origin recognition complex subunit 5 C-terminus-domain-containing protein [Dichomitus squalens]|uniref:Origin recognition complex subunit 5 C-terminus-domain-containing protein n=1 Tax=Dichomitus squalens TaxID=114155 RepID=A0A4Q9PUZ2_9APHY|nr:origin recognition complex subunit 5 C-terminus-domain-containing protein [Dichomitus squalens]